MGGRAVPDKLPKMPPQELPSRTLYQGRDRAAARSFLHAIGLTNADIDKARRLLGYAPQTSVQLGVTNFWHWYQRAVLRQETG